MSTLLETLNLTRHGSRLAIVDLSLPSSAREWSYDLFAQGITTTAVRWAEGQRPKWCSRTGAISQLAAWGIRKGTVVTVVIPNSVQFGLVFLALADVGAIAAPLNPAYTASEFEFYMTDGGSQYLLIDDSGQGKLAEHVASAVLNIPVLSVFLQRGAAQPCSACQKGKSPSPLVCITRGSSKPIGDAHLDHATIPKCWDPPAPDDVCLLLHTSGTTSRPKAVPLSQHNLSTTVKNITHTYILTESDRTQLVMPLFHVHGLMAGFLSSLHAGGGVIIPAGKGKFSASNFWPVVRDWKVSWFTAVPTILQVLLMRAKQDHAPLADALVPLRFIRSCSARLPASAVPCLEQAFGAPVLEAYAMTEATHMMTSNPLPERGPHKPGTVGIPQNVQVAIFDDASGRLLGPGEVGEVVVKGANVMKGYLNNPEANQAAFTEGGWFRTGDLGSFDSEGYLTCTGRKKDIINRGGEKISPSEIDDCLLAIPKVAEAVTFGAPDAKYGERVCCAVVPSEGSDLVEEDILSFCRQKLSGFKVPSQVYITTKLPKTATGKIQRRMVAEAFLDPKAP